MPCHCKHINCKKMVSDTYQSKTVMELPVSTQRPFPMVAETSPHKFKEKYQQLKSINSYIKIFTSKIPYSNVGQNIELSRLEFVEVFQERYNITLRHCQFRGHVGDSQSKILKSEDHGASPPQSQLTSVSSNKKHTALVYRRSR